MNTLTPYSDRWRERTVARMDALGIDAAAINEGTGFRGIQHAIYGDRSIDLEVMGPVDEYLDGLEERAEADALAELPDVCVVHHLGVGSPQVRRVDANLDALDGAHVQRAVQP